MTALFLSLVLVCWPFGWVFESSAKAGEDPCGAKVISMAFRGASALAKEKKWVELYEKLNMRLNNCTFELSPQKKSELLFFLLEATVGMEAKSLCQEKLKQMEEVRAQAKLSTEQTSRLDQYVQKCRP